MTDFEIAYPEIIALIEAYEKGLFKKMEKDPSDSDVRTAYMSNFINMENIVQAHVDASQMSKFNIIDNIIKQQNANEDASIEDYIGTNRYALNSSEKKAGQEKEDQIKPKVKETEFTYAECSITDEFGNYTDELFRSENKWYADKNNNLRNETWLNDEKIKKKYTFRATNKFEANYEARVTEYLNKVTGGADNKLTLGQGGPSSYFNFEDCLNCIIKIELKAVLPSLKIVFDFSNLLNKVKDLIKDFFNNLDPTKLLQMLCDFLMKFNGNFLCPQNLIGIQLLLPTLFAKYTFDLIKFRFDFTALLGPILKSILTSLVTLIENIPRITNPIIDCLINSITTIFKALESIAASLDKGVNETTDAIERIANIPFEFNERFLNSGKDTGESYEFRKAKEKLQSALGEVDVGTGTKAFDLYFNNPNTENMNSLIQDYKNLEQNNNLKRFIDFVQFYINEQEEKAFDRSKYEDINEYYNLCYDLLFNKNLNPFNIEGKTVLDLLNQESFYKSYQRGLLIERDKAERKRFETLKKAIENYDREQKEFIRDDKKKFFKFGLVAENKDYILPTGVKWNPMANRKYGVSTPDLKTVSKNKLRQLNLGVGFDKDVYEKIKKQYNSDKFSYLFSKYGIDLKSEYRTADVVDIPTLNTRKYIQSAFKTVDERFLFYLKFAKSWINETVNNVVLTLRSLDRFISEAFDAEFKILGNIQEIIHLVRFAGLIYELVANGLDSCDEIRKNKKMFKNILRKSQRDPKNGDFNQTSSALTFLDDDETSKMGYDPENVIVAMSKDGNYQTVIDLNECSDISQHIQLNDITLDSIYEGIKDV